MRVLHLKFHRAPRTVSHEVASTCRRVIWQGDAGSRRGLFAEFQNINMHAISSDQSAARKPCIYMQLEPSSSASADTAEGEADDEDVTPEVRLVPEDPSKCESHALTPIYHRLCRMGICQAWPLHSRSGLPKCCTFAVGDVLACHAVEELFQTLCDCAALNPDPQDAGAAFHCQPHHTYALVQQCSAFPVACLPSNCKGSM